MHSRRHEDFATQSSIVRDRQTDLGPDRFLVPRSRRSLSPRRMEGPHSHRVLGGDRRSSSLERRDYGWDLDGSRRDRVRSRSPPSGDVKRGPHYDGLVIDKDLPSSELHRRYELFDIMDMNCDVDSGMRNDYGYKHSTSRAIRDEFYGGRLNGGRHGMVGQKSAVLEDGASRGVYRLTADVGPTSKYDERGGNSSASVNLDLGHLRDVRVRYPDPFPLDKLSAMEPYGGGKKPMFHLRDAPYSGAAASKSKDLMGTSHFKDFASTSPGNTRVNYSGSYVGGMPLPAEDYPRSSFKITEPLAYTAYGQRHILDNGRDNDPEIKEALAQYGRDTFSPTRTEHRDYLHHRPGLRESDDYVYPSDDIYLKMDMRARADYGRKDFLRPSMIDPVTERVDNTEFSHGNLSNSSLWDHHSLEKQTVPNYIGLRRSPAASKPGGQYLDSASAHFQLGRKMSREQEMSYLGMSRDREITHRRIDYDFKRDAGPVSLRERMRSSPEFLYDTEMHRLAERTPRMEGEELGPYDPSNRILKRKYIMDEEMNRHSSRSIMPSKWNTSDRRADRNDRSEEWIGQDVRGPIIFSKRGGYAHGLNRRAERTYDGTDCHTDPTSGDWFSSHDPSDILHDHSTKLYKSGSKYSKGHSRPGPLGWYHPNRKHIYPKWKNVWIRGQDDDKVDEHTGDVEQLEDLVGFAKSEPPEDSEEFKQLVHKFFLSFTKKLNDNPVVQKRYEEQGRAGSLFCIVCGRSLSKEFMDTQRLATHAFMSHKVGLRAQHLGLHKAICVLLGWNSAVASDVVTWSPETLSSAEALAQREDLILWPPVIVIHYSSISNDDSQGQGLITVEALGDFLRGKGFGGGKIKSGRPANSSIMVVKFLGTFSGLQDAEKLHEYFAQNNRGRKEFEQIASSKGKSSHSREGEMKWSEKVNELELYGYMGIAEDLDKIDFDTKRKCLIKSKKEIQDLVDAHVKPE